jgi:hypothetical protein
VADFKQCPHEAVETTCGDGGCTCDCAPCRRLWAPEWSSRKPPRANVSERLAGVEALADEMRGTVLDAVSGTIRAALRPANASQTPSEAPRSHEGASPRVSRPSETGTPARTEKP